MAELNFDVMEISEIVKTKIQQKPLGYFSRVDLSDGHNMKSYYQAPQWCYSRMQTQYEKFS